MAGRSTVLEERQKQIHCFWEKDKSQCPPLVPAGRAGKVLPPKTKAKGRNTAKAHPVGPRHTGSE